MTNKFEEAKIKAIKSHQKHNTEMMLKTWKTIFYLFFSLLALAIGVFHVSDRIKENDRKKVKYKLQIELLELQIGNEKLNEKLSKQKSELEEKAYQKYISK